jgi:uncharacterized protein
VVTDPTPERHLGTLLATLSVVRRPGRFAFVDRADVLDGTAVHATVVEAEGTSTVIELGPADVQTIVPDFVAAWLTVEVHSALDAVGLTAALSGALADAGIPCNVLAGRLHDHLLVPEGEADRALAVLEGLRASHPPA